MIYPPEQEELSTVEDLDPEPESAGGWFTPAREGLVGILIVAGLLLFAGLQWIQSEIERNKSISYQAAEQAVVAQDWDRASELFTSASGYRDADQRARDASQHVKERDDHYGDALGHIAAKEWIAAVTDLAEVEKVQPHYSDTLRLTEQAKQGTYADALSGVVALRPKAQPPGLYYRVNDSWQWLEGSDVQSIVLGSGVRGQVVYDAPYRDLSSQVPGEMEAHERFWLEHFKPATNVSIESPGDGRRLMRATFPAGGAGSVASFEQLPFDTTNYDTFSWRSDGVWAFKFSNSYPPWRWPIGQGINEYRTIAYQKNGASAPTLIALPPATENRVLLDVDFAHPRLLEAEWTAPDDVRPVIHLFVSDIDGTNRRPIFTHYGSLVRAQFSPDSKYVLLTAVTFATAEDLSIGVGTVELVKVDLDGSASSHLIAQRSNVRNARLGGNSAPVSTAIVSEGPYAGRILMSWQNDGESTSTLQVLDPYDSATPPVEVTIATKGAPNSLHWVGVQDNAGLVFTLQFYPQDISSGEEVSATVTLVRFPPEGEPLVGNLALNGMGFITLAQARPSGLFYPYVPYADTGVSIFEIDRVPDSALLKASDPYAWVRKVKPERLYAPTIPKRGSQIPEGAALLSTINFGPRALAYTDGTDLYAASYEHAATIKLESDVTSVYSVTEMRSDYLALH